MKTALFVGRFQPMHNAHLDVIKKIISEYKLIVGIGRAQESRTLKNPFTAEERKEMVSNVLRNVDCEVILIPDKPEDEVWLGYVSRLCPLFDVVFTGNPETKECFEGSKYEVIEVSLKEGISSSIIREKILKDEEFKDIVPKEVYNFIQKF